MKIYSFILAVLLLTCSSFGETIETNVVSSIEPVEYGGYELTFGTWGETTKGDDSFGIDVSVATNPLKFRPEVWFGVVQSAYWEPTLSGSTDLTSEWAQRIWKEKLYLNIGWSGGVLYGHSTSSVWRTGPQATFQWYLEGNAFLFAGVNYDVFRSDGNNHGFRHSFGIGLAF